MTDDTPLGAALYAEMIQQDGATFEHEVHRERIEPGRSFSEDAMEALIVAMSVWVGTRVMRRWEATNEPPTVLRVTVTVDVA